MNSNQIRHLVSASEGVNLLEAKVSEVRHDPVEVLSSPPMVAQPLTSGASIRPSYQTRTIYLTERHEVRGQQIKAAYDYRTNTIFYRRIIK